MTTYQLTFPSSGRLEAPVLDGHQRSVVDHDRGPLLVLAGPGTGKTTTLVEAIVDRIERRGADPASVLALTFSRKAAEQLRDRVTARLGRTMATTLSSTFHSFAYGLVRQHAPREVYTAPLRLLSAPEQDVVIQQLLEGNRAEGDRLWPESLALALGTRGFAREVQAVLARAREKGLDPLDLKEMGERSQAPELVAAARFMQQYQVILDDQASIDYPELIYRAVLLAERPDVRADLRSRFSHVFVDEYQDTDPSQVRLLQALAGDGRNLVVVGDPDQSIYGFRGAEVRGILDFPKEFPHADGRPADTVALRVTRRFGPRLLAASRAIASSIAAQGAIDAATFSAFRNPAPADNAYGDGRVEVCTFDTERSETEHVADLLRRAHLEDGVPWSDMAVLVRSGRTSIPRLRRSLGAAGVPVEVASDDTPLVQEPAVLPLLDALRAVLNLDNDDPEDVDHLGADRAGALLVSPLGALDATEVRALARQLRAREKQGDGETQRTSPELLREALLRPELLDGLSGRAARKAGVLARLLRAAQTALLAGATAEEVLWLLWDGTDWRHRLRRGVENGGGAARMAHRDLDSLCALFEVAAKAEEQRGHTSVRSFLSTLAAQQIPADTLAERGVRGDAVRLLTAHRSKGLEWRFVVVAHVQEEGWPDLRRRTSLLHADRIGADGLLPPTTVQTLLAEERRLFYVACTRARERLLVTAVRSPEDDGEQPSRFVDELDVPGPVLATSAGDGSGPAEPERSYDYVTTFPAGEDSGEGSDAASDGAGAADPVVVRRHVQGRPVRPLSLAGIVAELRRTVADPEAAPGLRDAAARRLARLAVTVDHGDPLVPQADPASWWGTRARSTSPRPLRPVDEPVVVSATTLTSVLTCPAQWFLEREAGGAKPPSQAQGFGKVVHALADRVAKGEVVGAGDDLVADLMQHVDSVWGRIAFRTPWSRARERTEVEAVLRRFVQWHQRPGARRVIATEQQLTAEVTLPDGHQIRLHGYADRLELDEDGKVVVIDLKTSKYPPTDKDLPANPQLGLYQLAVESGAVDELLDDPGRSGGAELIQLRKEARGSVKVQKQEPQARNEDGHTEVEVQLMEALGVIRSELIEARPGKHCDNCDFEAICPVKGAGTVLS